VSELKNIVIEVGVNRGQDTLRLCNTYGTDVHGFEPTPNLQPKLKAMYGNHPRIHIHQAAVDITDGYSDFNVQDRKEGGGGASSLYSFSTDIHETWADRTDFDFEETVKVKTTRLDTFLDTLKFKNISYLHCDAQGNDLNVLRSLGEYIDRVEAGQIEVAYTVELYSGNDNTVTVAQRWLQDRGFTTTVKPDKVNKEADIHFTRAT